MEESPLHAAEERIVELEKRLKDKEASYNALWKMYESCDKERMTINGKLALATAWAAKMLELFRYEG